MIIDSQLREQKSAVSLQNTNSINNTAKSTTTTTNTESNPFIVHPIQFSRQNYENVNLNILICLMNQGTLTQRFCDNIWACRR